MNSWNMSSMIMINVTWKNLDTRTSFVPIRQLVLLFVQSHCTIALYNPIVQSRPYR